MLVNPLVYDLGMTLVLARVTSDNSIVLSADGMALNTDDTIFSDSEQKIFQLVDEIYWAVAASGIYPGELKQLNLYLGESFRRLTEVAPTYTMTTVATLFSERVKAWFDVNRRDDLRADFVLAGFSKQAGQYIDPRIYTVSSDNYFVPDQASISTLVGNIEEIYREEFNTMPIDEDSYIDRSHSLIEKVSRNEPSVGGQIVTVIINGDMSKKLFKKLIKRASQPAPKEPGK